jgi:hypothetical protein
MMIFTGRRGIVLLILFNVVALLAWAPVLRLGADQMRLHARGSLFSYMLFLFTAILLSFLYAFLILLANKFLAQNRTDRLPLRIARTCFAIEVVAYPIAALVYLYR